MKQTIPELIKENKDLHQILLVQEGGIMKYLAEHLEANGTAALFNDYQNHCVDIFFEKNKWDLSVVWEGDNMRRAALGSGEHLMKELNYWNALKPLIVEIEKNTLEEIENFMDLYLSYAYKQHRLRWHPQGFSNRNIYNDVIELFSSSGLAYKCMKIILREHHDNAENEKSATDLWTEFMIRQWTENFNNGEVGQMRMAIAEIVDGKTGEQCKQMAMATMKKVRSFSQMIYTDEVVEHLRFSGLMDDADRRESDGKWLREIAQRAMLEAFSDHIKTYSMRFYFAEFVSILQDVGRFWAAQLLDRNIDMRELEKEVCCILNPDEGYRYYVDKYFSDDLPDQYCIYDNEQAEAKLKKLGRKVPKDSYLEVIDKTLEEDIRNKLSKGYLQLKEEGLLNDKSTRQTTFIDVLMNQSNWKIVWLNDPTLTYLMTFIKVLLGESKLYSYPPILKLNEKGSYSAFVKTHFVDEDYGTIDFKTNIHEIGKKQAKKMENILIAIYGEIKERK